MSSFSLQSAPPPSENIVPLLLCLEENTSMSSWKVTSVCGTNQTP